MRRLERLSPSNRSQIFRIGDREVEARGLSRVRWGDLYHRAMIVSWPAFFGWAAVVFVILNSGYATLYLLGDNPIANASAGDFLKFFFFSVETLATVGYGDMHPQTVYGHIVATVEIFTGMAFLAVMTGLVFARVSRPKASFVFAQYAVVTTHEGQPTLMIRVANARHDTISGANAALWMIRAEITPEGHTLRRYHELKLDRRENPVFILSWTIMHVADESSPLSGMDEAQLGNSETALVLTLNGFDDSSAQQLWARGVYASKDIRWRHHYVDITSWADGRVIVDYEKFHDIEPDVPAAQAKTVPPLNAESERPR